MPSFTVAQSSNISGQCVAAFGGATTLNAYNSNQKWTFTANGAAITLGAVGFGGVNNCANDTLTLDGNSTGNTLGSITQPTNNGTWSIGLTKQGSGTWTLYGSNTYTL